MVSLDGRERFAVACRTSTDTRTCFRKVERFCGRHGAQSTVWQTFLWSAGTLQEPRENVASWSPRLVVFVAMVPCLSMRADADERMRELRVTTKGVRRAIWSANLARIVRAERTMTDRVVEIATAVLGKKLEMGCAWVVKQSTGWLDLVQNRQLLKAFINNGGDGWHTLCVAPAGLVNPIRDGSHAP